MKQIAKLLQQVRSLYLQLLHRDALRSPQSWHWLVWCFWANCKPVWRRRHALRRETEARESVCARCCTPACMLCSSSFLFHVWHPLCLGFPPHTVPSKSHHLSRPSPDRACSSPEPLAPPWPHAARHAVSLCFLTKVRGPQRQRQEIQRCR